MSEVGPLTQALKAQARIEELEEAKRKDNESLLQQLGEAQCEIDRLKPFEALAFDLGSQLKQLVTATCPVVHQRPSDVWVEQWEALEEAWKEASEKVGVTTVDSVANG